MSNGKERLPRRKLADIVVGQRYGRLVATGLTRCAKTNQLLAVCSCDCGSVVTQQMHYLVSGRRVSCGCKSREGRVGDKTKKPEYIPWAAMIARCYCEGSDRYPYYGGRGIKVCEKWRSSFDAFLLDVGERPTSGHSLERDDVNGHYEPGNVRWATRKEQARNRRNSRKLTVNGITRTIAEWSELTGISRSMIEYRIKRGQMTPEQIVSTPVKTTKKSPQKKTEEQVSDFPPEGLAILRERAEGE